MKQKGEFEIYELFHFRNDQIVLIGKLRSGGPISNEQDVVHRDFLVSFFHNGTETKSKVIRMETGFTRPGQDIVIHSGDNVALVIESGPETEKWTNQVFTPNTLSGKLLAKIKT